MAAPYSIEGAALHQYNFFLPWERMGGASIILEKYFFLQTTITKSLQNQFREFCRPFKPRQSSSASTSSSEPKGSSTTKSQSIVSTLPVPDGEDRW